MLGKLKSRLGKEVSLRSPGEFVLRHQPAIGPGLASSLNHLEKSDTLVTELLWSSMCSSKISPTVVKLKSRFLTHGFRCCVSVIILSSRELAAPEALPTSTSTIRCCLLTQLGSPTQMSDFWTATTSESSHDSGLCTVPCRTWPTAVSGDQLCLMR
ncbi:hypothetical protein BX600DRAFT_271487 [Xylariales sp. PMI_506]|nr:hypothetical protein BX600DRAFT_271487 [Xylariales sp. PMI_506]